MGLARNATLPVIKAAYKALVLVHHPDKTVHMSHSDRSNHAVVFRNIRDAYDVVGNPISKAAYDEELRYHDNMLDTQHSTSHQTFSSRNRNIIPNLSRQPTITIHVTTAEEKEAVRARVETQLAQLAEAREQRNREVAILDTTGLRYTLKCWQDMAMQLKNDQMMKAHCQIKVVEYEELLRIRKAEQREWLEKLSMPKRQSQTAVISQGSLRNQGSTSYSTARAQQKAEERKRSEQQKARQAVKEAQARAAEEIRQNALRKAQREVKAVSVQAKKGKQQDLRNTAAAMENERISTARTKVAPAQKATAYASTYSTTSKLLNTNTSKSAVKKNCKKCDTQHASVVQWKRCGQITANEEIEDSSFLQVV